MDNTLIHTAKRVTILLSMNIAEILIYSAVQAMILYLQTSLATTTFMEMKEMTSSMVGIREASLKDMKVMIRSMVEMMKIICMVEKETMC